ncbi:L domain-like protein [Rickenella mellea]|uniref:L domain-like protein n=1 Tax=Rickenella mellea TaxID=50990 RepID=A0A4Y7PZD7_9AGAM|nr:L domain-like protein [Rickenella mellea]
MSRINQSQPSTPRKPQSRIGVSSAAKPLQSSSRIRTQSTPKPTEEQTGLKRGTQSAFSSTLNPNNSPSGHLRPKPSLGSLRKPQEGRSRTPTGSTGSPRVEAELPKAPLSIKEAIALKRAEAKKLQAKAASPGDDSLGVIEGAEIGVGSTAEDDALEIGRMSTRETIERAQRTGHLPCIPNCLFDIHLGITPAPLKLAPEADADVHDEPKGKERTQVSRFDAQDLQVLKARTNDIIELQPEISLFGSLKTIDLHSNRLETVPTTLTNLSSLSVLDLSSNRLRALPPSLFSLPSLTNLNLSRNELTSLPFSKFGIAFELPDPMRRGSFLPPVVKRANTPLPCLHTLEVAYNKISSSSIDVSHLPANISLLVLSHNPLGPSSNLIQALSKLGKLKEVRMEHADITDESFPPSTSPRFPQLQHLDLEEAQVTEATIRSFFAGSARENELSFDITTSAPAPGELRVAVGKKVIKEAWEIEAEKRFMKKRGVAAAPQGTDASSSGLGPKSDPIPVEKEPWEIEAEQRLPTEAGRRKAKAAAAATQAHSSPPPPKPSTPPARQPKPIEKEPWEVEAEQGLLTEAGRRRARAHADESHSATQTAPVAPALGLANPTYFSATTQTLTLPPSAPPSRGHARAFSLVASPQKLKRSNDDLSVPAPVLPLAVIARQSFAATLRILVVNNRRADSTFDIPSPSDLLSSSGVLPNLDELYLENCNLGDTVSVNQASADGAQTPPARKEKTVDLLATLFPTLSILDLSYNTLSSDALSMATLQLLLLPSSGDGPAAQKRRGLKILRLRGNMLVDLSGFEGIAELFKGNRQVEGWKLEELDVRDNEIAKLPALVGLLPLDVFLVDGNTFRIPQRKVWEREGTKGLLSWLRGRME